MKTSIQKIIARMPYGYTILYYIAYLSSVIFSFKKKEFDLAFIIAGKGWILEKISKEIEKRYEGKSAFHYSVSNIPRADAYFFSVYRQFLAAAIRNPHIFLGDVYVFYTHFTEGPIAEKNLGRILNLAKMIFVMNSNDKDFLIGLGVNSNKIQVVLVGVNENVFVPNHTKTGDKKTIGFCLRYEGREGYSYRKNYNKIIDLIKATDEFDVILLGYKWHNFDRLKEVQPLSYFSYVETDYSNYQDYYNKMDIFVSLSRVEGAPVPLLEAMFCNVFPVVSETGFARDLIIKGENGFVFDTEASIEEIITLLGEASKVAGVVDVRKTVDHLTWENFSQKIINHISKKIQNREEI